jgi:opacity protein-like surface antigen
MTQCKRRSVLFAWVTSAISSLVLPQAASAADMSVKAPKYQAPVVTPAYNWLGLYVGANFGAGWTNGSLNLPGNNLYGGITEFISGGQVGYNVQAGGLLFGVEGDFDWASFNHPAFSVPTLGSVSQHRISTVAGRFGLVNDRWLVLD